MMGQSKGADCGTRKIWTASASAPNKYPGFYPDTVSPNMIIPLTSALCKMCPLGRLLLRLRIPGSKVTELGMPSGSDGECRGALWLVVMCPG